MVKMDRKLQLEQTDSWNLALLSLMIYIPIIYTSAMTLVKFMDIDCIGIYACIYTLICM